MINRIYDVKKLVYVIYIESNRSKWNQIIQFNKITDSLTQIMSVIQSDSISGLNLLCKYCSTHNGQMNLYEISRCSTTISMNIVRIVLSLNQQEKKLIYFGTHFSMKCSLFFSSEEKPLKNKSNVNKLFKI